MRGTATVIPSGRVIRRARGLALVAVLWLVAALMVTASGIVYAVRGEVRAVSAVGEMAAAGALADAGLMLAVRELKRQPNRESRLLRYETEFEGSPMGIRVVPLSGLVDVNSAGEPLLTELMAVAGGVDRSEAVRLAQRIIDWRDPDDQARTEGAEDAAYAAAGSPFRTRGGPFVAPEDLLQVLGIDFDLYLRLRPLITVHFRGNGRIDPAAAPLPVLRVLAAGNEEIASDFDKARQVDGALADTTRFPAALVVRSQTSRVLIEASVPLANGARMVSRRILDISSPRDGLPWLTLWAEHAVEPSLPD